MEQCLHCGQRLYFVPLPGEVFTSCLAHGEEVCQIDLATGVSPAIKKHGIRKVPCERFIAGKSLCETADDKPFTLHPVRDAGEKYLLKVGFAQSA